MVDPLFREQRLRGIFDRILREIERAEAKHPGWPADPLRQVAIVNEEAGEALQATLNAIEYGETERASTRAMVNMFKDIDEEIVQTGAMVFRFLYYKGEMHDSAQRSPSASEADRTSATGVVVDRDPGDHSG